VLRTLIEKIVLRPGVGFHLYLQMHIAMIVNDAHHRLHRRNVKSAKNIPSSASRVVSRRQ
jgi:hypothetical protein